MGLLLMEFEYQRAKQDLNMDQLEGTRLSSLTKQYTKRLAYVQSIFSKRKTQIESKWNNISSDINNQISTSMANNSFSNLAGLTIPGLAAGALAQTLSGATNQTNPASTDNSAQTNAQMKMISAANELKSELQSQLELLKEAELDKLEEQEDKQEEPITEKNNDIDGKVAANNMLTEIDQQRVQNAESKLGQVAKDSMPHYGLS